MSMACTTLTLMSIDCTTLQLLSRAKTRQYLIHVYALFIDMSMDKDREFITGFLELYREKKMPVVHQDKGVCQQAQAQPRV